jgi:hypothetical protein
MESLPVPQAVLRIDYGNGRIMTYNIKKINRFSIAPLPSKDLSRLSRMVFELEANIYNIEMVATDEPA